MEMTTGIDITEVRRLRRSIEKLGDAFLNKVFTRTELADSKKRASPLHYLTGRFAAKEAVYKAIGDTGLGWKDICVLNDASGRPYCRLLKGKGKGRNVRISISHVKDYAFAAALVVSQR